MTQERLNNVMLLHAHKQRTDSLNLQETATTFAGHNNNEETILDHFKLNYLEC